MYEVSNAYKTAMLELHQRCQIGGTINDIEFDEDKIVKNSVQIDWQSTNSNNFTFGGVFATKLTLTFSENILGRGNWLDKEIVLYYGQILDDDTVEEVPIGHFFVDSVNYSDTGVNVTAYDAMTNFDKNVYDFSTSGNIYNIFKLVCEECGVTCGMTQEEFEALPNGSIVTGFSNNNSVSTYRDLLHHIAMTCCGFATIDRSGECVIKNFNSTEVATLTMAHRISGSKYSDYPVDYTQVQFIDSSKENTITEVHSQTNDGMIMDFGSNPFVPTLVDATRNSVLANWLMYASSLTFVPFKATLIGNPAFDIGDCLKFTGGMASASGIKVALSTVTWRYGQSYVASGADMAVTNTSVGASSGGNSYATSSNEWKMFVYKNSSEITISGDSTDVVISEITINTTDKTQVEVTTQLNVIPASLTDITLYYTVGDTSYILENITHHMHEYGLYIITLNKTFSLDETGSHKIRIYARSNAAPVTIGEKKVETCVKGTKLTSISGWDGNVTVEDTLTFTRGLWRSIPNNDTAILSFGTVFTNNVCDNSLDFYRMMNRNVQLDESYSIYRERNSYYITDENSNRITDEDYNELKTE